MRINVNDLGELQAGDTVESVTEQGYIISRIDADDFTQEIPVYTRRNLEEIVIEKISSTDSVDTLSLLWNGGTGCGVAYDVGRLMTVGKPVIIETQNYSTITGWIIDGKWYGRKSDQDLARDLAKFVEDSNARRRKLLDENRENWQAREDALPEWIKTRIDFFHERGGENFELDGWGYELIVCELAAMYYALGEVILDKTMSEISEFESEEITTFAAEHGTSGNQHGYALTLAKTHMSDSVTTLRGTVSALSPINGNAFYEKS